MAQAAVLLSTFNGERHLEELLESLAGQSHPDVVLRIRDDGSTDHTWELLNRFGRSFPNMHITRGPNLGPADSFLELIREVPASVDYFGFCDQDDVWDRDKVAVAVEHLEKYHNRPALYFSRLRITNEKLETLRLSPLPQRPPGIANALAQNIVTGCACAVNRPAIELLQATLPPAGQIRMHDWWTYQVVSGTGDVIFDPEPRISYRQHAGNVIGHPGPLTRWRRRLARTRVRKGQLLRHARLLRDQVSGYLASGEETLIDEFIEVLSRAATAPRLDYILKMPVYRQSGLDTLILRVLILLKLA